METQKDRRGGKAAPTNIPAGSGEDKPDPRAKAAEKVRKDLEDDHKYGGRGEEAPDRDVNPVDDLHVHDDEEGDPAETGHHDAQQRKRGKEKDSRVS